MRVSFFNPTPIQIQIQLQSDQTLIREKLNLVTLCVFYALQTSLKRRRFPWASLDLVQQYYCFDKDPPPLIIENHTKLVENEGRSKNLFI